MLGLGENFNINKLNYMNIESFQKSFYNQLFYTPIISHTVYDDILECEGYHIDENWYNNFYINYDINEEINKYELKLEDNNNVLIKVFKIPDNLIAYSIDDIKKCFVHTSIEVDILNIKSARKMLILLNK